MAPQTCLPPDTGPKREQRQGGSDVSASPGPQTRGARHRRDSPCKPWSEGPGTAYLSMPSPISSSPSSSSSRGPSVPSSPSDSSSKGGRSRPGLEVRASVRRELLRPGLEVRGSLARRRGPGLDASVKDSEDSCERRQAWSGRGPTALPGTSPPTRGVCLSPRTADPAGLRLCTYCRPLGRLTARSGPWPGFPPIWTPRGELPGEAGREGGRPRRGPALGPEARLLTKTSRGKGARRRRPGRGAREPTGWGTAGPAGPPDQSAESGPGAPGPAPRSPPSPRRAPLLLRPPRPVFAPKAAHVTARAREAADATRRHDVGDRVLSGRRSGSGPRAWPRPAPPRPPEAHDVDYRVLPAVALRGGPTPRPGRPKPAQHAPRPRPACPRPRPARARRCGTR